MEKEERTKPSKKAYVKNYCLWEKKLIYTMTKKKCHEEWSNIKRLPNGKVSGILFLKIMTRKVLTSRYTIGNFPRWQNNLRSLLKESKSPKDLVPNHWKQWFCISLLFYSDSMLYNTINNSLWYTWFQFYTMSPYNKGCDKENYINLDMQILRGIFFHTNYCPLWKPGKEFWEVLGDGKKEERKGPFPTENHMSKCIWKFRPMSVL